MEKKKEPNDPSVAELRSALKQAEPGPWELGEPANGYVEIFAPRHGNMASAVWQMDDDANRGRISPKCEANARILAQARRSAERLVEAMDLVESLEAENTVLRRPTEVKHPAAPPDKVPHWPALYSSAPGLVSMTNGLYSQADDVASRVAHLGAFIRLATELPPVFLESKK